MMKTMENLGSRVLLECFRVPGLGSYFMDPEFWVPFEFFGVPGRTLGAKVPGPTYTFWGLRSWVLGSQF